MTNVQDTEQHVAENIKSLNLVKKFTINLGDSSLGCVNKCKDNLLWRVSNFY